MHQFLLARIRVIALAIAENTVFLCGKSPNPMKRTSTHAWIIVLFCVLHINASSQTNHLVISQLFGSGGVSATLPSHDFIELYNPTGTAVNINGYSVQFAFGSATTYIKIPLSGFIIAKSYYLIQLGRDSYFAGLTMPQTDIGYNYNINSPDMKVGLYNFTSSVSGSNPSATAVDFIGTGVATGYESAASPQGAYNVSLMRKSSATSTVPSMASTGAEYRKGNGYDTNNNLTDLLLTANVVARSANSNPLALNFRSFDLTKTATGNLLRWQVDASQEAKLFEVEKSADGISFSSIGQVAPQSATAYQFIDAGNALSAHYRIKTVSKDGELRYSATLFAEGKPTAAMKVYPTVASSSVQVQLPESARGNRISIYAATGTLQQQITLADKQTQVSLSIASLKPGTYFLQVISTSGKVRTEQFVKAG